MIYKISIYNEGNFHMDDFVKDQNEDHLEEPPLEDFLPNEEDVLIKERQKKRKSWITKVVSIIVSFALIVSAIQIWPQLFNLSSIPFLQKSAELSQQEDIQKYKEAVVTIQDENTRGTGFNISKNGLIITNYHVVDGMNPITISFPHGELLKASILESDPDLDLAILQVKGEDLPFITLSKPDVWRTQDPIYVIGNPLFHNQIVNEGEILDGSNQYGVLLLSAPIYKGNSGSPVISSNGDVIGVVFAKSTEDPIGYAIPIEKVLERLPKGY
jgi:serine protease Do